MAIDLTSANKSGGAVMVNITSLMDVLTIILIFLLLNYSDEAEKESPPSYIELPGVVGKTLMLPNDAAVVNVGRDRIVINGEERMFSGLPAGFDVSMRFEDGAPGEDEYQLALVEIYANNAEMILDFTDGKFQEILSERDAPETPTVTFQADKLVPYDLIKELVLLAGQQGLGQIELVATREEE
jgi:biopolymer transport protein ExbD